MVNCPFHQDDTPSLAVYDDHVFCFGCRRYSRDAALVAKLRAEAPRRFGRSHGENAVSYVPNSMVGAYQDMLAASPEAMAYLRGRGLSDTIIRKARLGFSGAALVIPVYDETWRLQTLRFRRRWDDDEGPKYWGLPGKNQTTLFGLHLIPPRVGWVWLCEGEFDALRLLSEDVPAVSATNGTNVLKVVPSLDRFKTVFIALDQDEPGQRTAREVKRLLGRRGEIVRWEGGKDITEALRERSFRQWLQSCTWN